MPTIATKQLVTSIVVLVLRAGTAGCSEPAVLEIPTFRSEVAKRSIAVEDIARLRLISRSAGRSDGASPFSVSPDGGSVAFQLRQGDPSLNIWRTAWFIAPLKPDAQAINVGDAGDAYIMDQDGNGVPSGDVIAPSPASWSPDGKWIAYVRWKSGELQLWRSRVDGEVQEQLTHDEADVEEAVWSAEQTKIFFTTLHEPRAATRAKVETESRRGFLIDDRTWPAVSKYPLPFVGGETDVQVFDTMSVTSRSATDTERQLFSMLKEHRTITGVLPQAMSVQQERASRLNAMHPISFDRTGRRIAYANVLEPTDRVYLPTVILSTISVAKPELPLTCSDPICKGIISQIWWRDDGEEIYFERQTENDTIEGIYAWSWRQQIVRQVVKTQAILDGCAFSKNRLICHYETTIQPNLVVSVNLRTGRITPIVDPNPEFKNILLTDIERLDWTSRIDDDVRDDHAFGYLIKPREYKPGMKYPLVILTKIAQGFVPQGGEYPPHLFATGGLMVFICQEPFASLYRLGDEGRFKNDFQMRRHTQASLEAGIVALEKRGLIDPDRIALTGYSDGVELTYFALYRSTRRFAAAIVSTNDWEPIAYYLLPAYLRDGIYKQMGIASSAGPAQWFYDGEAPSRNVDKLRTPILHHIADAEMLEAMQTMVMMDEHHKPFEGYVFPGEYHTKWQPAHLYTIWRRNTQWLQFWLQDKEVNDPVDKEQYVRWRKLRLMQQVATHE